jgi:hypothetical protein
MDPRIQIRILFHTKMSWIRNTEENALLKKISDNDPAFYLNTDPNPDTDQGPDPEFS